METYMVDQMSKYYNNNVFNDYNLNKIIGNNSGTFQQAIEKILEQQARKTGQVNNTNQATTSANVNTVSTKDMSMQDYKDYIHNKITNLYLNPAQGNSVYSIQISDECFERMKNEPEFEQHVIGSIQQNMQYAPPMIGGNPSSYIYLYFDKDENNDRGYGYTMGSENNNIWGVNDSKKSFWQKTAKEKEKEKKLLQLQHDKKCLEQAQLDQVALGKRLAIQMSLQNYGSDLLFGQGAYSMSNPFMYNTDIAQAYSSVEADMMSLLTEGII